MIINKQYDVFIAFHGSSGEDGDLEQARRVYNYLKDQGIKCFLFSENSDSSAYKANFVKIMQSRLLLLVCNDKLYRRESGEMDYLKNYHLFVELDSFLALAQSDSTMTSVNDAALIYFSDNGNRIVTPSPETIHPLFSNRDSFYVATPDTEEEALESVLDWVKDRLDFSRETALSGETVAILNGRSLGALDKKVENLDLKKLIRKATLIKCMGISNWTFSLTDGCNNLIRGIRRGTVFEMLFLDPEGKNVKIRSEEERKDTSQQIYASFDMIKAELQSKFTDKSVINKCLRTYTYDQIPRENLIFIYTAEEAYVIVQNYSFQSPGAKCPCFIFKHADADGESLFEYYEAVYEAIVNDPGTKRIDLFRTEE